LGRIGGNAGNMLFKIGLSVAQPIKTKEEINATIRLIISGIRTDAEPGVRFPIISPFFQPSSPLGGF
jgi:hypothetical protein